MAEPSTLAGAGAFVGRYRIVDELGVGGMATVHLARADGPGGFQKWVALKRIHPHLAEDAQFIDMFLDEARIAARISHPNVAQVFDLGRAGNTYWLAMEYLHGEPLREVLRLIEDGAAPMPPEIAAKVCADAAEGLHAAHELRGRDGQPLGLVHRDVSPHNLFVTFEGGVKVVDFGVAKARGRLSDTHVGILKGKVAYMSPEQTRGEAIDRRTDVFALGVVLWELTTGRRLFRSDSDLETVARVQACRVPKPSSLVPGYPLALERIVMGALEPRPEARWPTARHFARELQRFVISIGHLVTADEVGGYLKSMLIQRFETRQAYLERAAEVTRTSAMEELEAIDVTEEVSMLTDVDAVAPGARAAAYGYEEDEDAATRVVAPVSRAPASSPRAPLPPPAALPPLPSFGLAPGVLAGAAYDEEDEALTSVRVSPLEGPGLQVTIPRPAASPRSDAQHTASVMIREPAPVMAPAVPAVPAVASAPAGPRFGPVVWVLAAVSALAVAGVLVVLADRTRERSSPVTVTVTAQAAPPSPAALPAAAVTGSAAMLAEAPAASPAPSVAAPEARPAPVAEPRAVERAPAVAALVPAAARAVAAPTKPAPPTPDKLVGPGASVAEAKPSVPAAGAPGYLTVVCDPFCDAVVVGGRNLGPSPVLRHPLPPGSHGVRLKKSGAPQQSLSVTIVSGQTTAQRVKMGS